jgi:hypothetical protein
MYIFVDESGTFTAPAPAAADSWCVVAAYTSPETDQERLSALVMQLRQDCGSDMEVKIDQVGEARYLRFLRDLSRLAGLVFAVAVDVSLHSKMAVLAHRDAQAEKVVEHRSKMIHVKARDAITALGESMHSLPVQLYTQLQCQVELFHKVLAQAPLYYSQHKPETLSRLSWRIDRKDTIPTAYETAFRTILPMALQSKSMREPMIALREGNYEFFKRFEFPAGQYPAYLEEQYGIKSSGVGMNLGKMVGEDFDLVDSNAVLGVQVADLIASGLRRLFRGKFERAHEIALGLSANMVSELRGGPQVRLVSLSQSAPVSDRSAALLELLARRPKPLVG